LLEGRKESKMKIYRIEHIGIAVSDPIKMANWYREILGFEIKFAAEDSEKAVAFVTDADNKAMVELGKIPDVPALRDQIKHHLQFHIALESEDPYKEVDYLVENGAKFIEKCPVARPGDSLVVLEDPWGNCIQLVKRDKGGI
jgi:catechol 2,3-dioxygenase-like lactoylglutathione lyase family enzyme